LSAHMVRLLWPHRSLRWHQGDDLILPIRGCGSGQRNTAETDYASAGFAGRSS
jgi:hypothetical protein